MKYSAILAMVVCLYSLPVAALEDISTLYHSLEKQKLSLPTHIRAGLFLTDIVIKENEKNIKRYYDHSLLDFGLLSDRQAKGFSRSLAGELFEQCATHKSLIYDQAMRFQYYIRDREGRLMMLVNVNAEECDTFAYHHLPKHIM